MKLTKHFRVSSLRRGMYPVTTRQKASVTPAEDNIAHMAALEMAHLGFQLRPDQLHGLSVDVMETMIADARHVIGADRAMRPVYPGFPRQVQALDTLTLLMEQLLHYWTAGEFLPNYEDVAREGLPLEDMAAAQRAVRIMPAHQVARENITALTQSMVAISADDKTLLEGSVEMVSPTVEELASVLKGSRHGENMQTLLSVVREVSLQKVNTDDLLIAVIPAARNADQLLRFTLALYAEISGNRVLNKHVDGFTRATRHLSDVDNRAFRMRTMSRPARRALLTRLGKVTGGFSADSLVARRELWRRVMRMMHPYSVKVSGAVQSSAQEDAVDAENAGLYAEDAETALTAGQDAETALTAAEKTRRALDIIHENVEHRTLNSRIEEAMAARAVDTVVSLLSEHQPGNLLRRVVALLRICDSEREVDVLASALREHGLRSEMTTVISAYNGVLGANENGPRLVRVAGRNNTVLSAEEKSRSVDVRFISTVLSALEGVLRSMLAEKPVPAAPVGVSGDSPVPLVRRDASTSDRVMDRGERVTMAGEGDTLRIFGHWNNNQDRSGYMDIGVVVLDEDYGVLGVVTWNTWSRTRQWSTYSGDKLVSPGNSAAEYIDVSLSGVRSELKGARWLAMTVQSWSGFPTCDVDMIAGAMRRSKQESGEVFEPRSVVSAFKPTTKATQSVPLVVDLVSGDMVWIDSSSGATASGVSAADDVSVGSVVYHEVAAPRLSMGHLARLYAESHGVETDEGASVDRDAVLELLN